MHFTRFGRVVLGMALAGFSGAALAQSAAPAAPATVALPVDAGLLMPPAAPTTTLVIPALTTVALEMLDTISSATSHTGDSFALRLSKPIVVDGVEVVPAGATGVGEVVHAKKSGGSGAAGELIAAARYLDVDGRRLRLRSMQVATTGRDQTELAMISAQAISFFAFAVRGKNTEIPKGLHVTAKVAEAFAVTVPPTPPAPVAPPAPPPAAN